jgi:hypothetical protein
MWLLWRLKAIAEKCTSHRIPDIVDTVRSRCQGFLYSEQYDITLVDEINYTTFYVFYILKFLAIISIDY